MVDNKVRPNRLYFGLMDWGFPAPGREVGRLRLHIRERAATGNSRIICHQNKKLPDVARANYEAARAT
jgi:hypothetical protein